MHLEKYSTKEIVEHCLKQGKEGEYWDFKQEWHENPGDLVKDIVCFANTVHNEKCYLIFGVSDSLEVVGMSKSRRKQADIIDLLSHVQFAEDISSKISVETVQIRGKEIDVLIIDNVEHTPIYLNKRFGNMIQGCIYSRVGDRNTPDNGNADCSTIELLWKKRLGLTKPVYEYIMDHLQYWQDWKEHDGDYYYIYNPEYRIHNRHDDEGRKKNEFYAYTQTDSNVMYSMIDIIANNTVLASHQIVYLDGGRLCIPVPEWGHIYRDEWQDKSYAYKFYIVDSHKFQLLEFMYNSDDREQKMAFDQFYKVILFFTSEEEHQNFERYIAAHLDVLEQLIKSEKEYWFLNLPEPENSGVQERLKIGIALKKMLKQWRHENYIKEPNLRLYMEKS